jgi:chromosome condensin MukBEF MukE localization factor
MNDKSVFALPELRDVFDSLRRGRHICPEDGKLYWALRDNLESYQELFRNLGFDLQVHPRDFYYFRGKDSLSPQASRMAVFVFILIEALSDAGEPVVDTLMTRAFAVQDLPHFKSARYRAYLKEVGAASNDDLRGAVRQLERFGFVQRLTEETFRFRAPAYRFFDICTQILKQPGTASGEIS